MKHHTPSLRDIETRLIEHVKKLGPTETMRRTGLPRTTVKRFAHRSSDVIISTLAKIADGLGARVRITLPKIDRRPDRSTKAHVGKRRSRRNRRRAGKAAAQAK